MSAAFCIDDVPPTTVTARRSANNYFLSKDRRTPLAAIAVVGSSDRHNASTNARDTIDFFIILYLPKLKLI
jgi:hypothetical protein